jgi:hypothetical protein
MVHSQQHQKNWTPTRTDYTNQVTDEDYQGIIGYHNPIWKYIINRHDDRDNLCPLNIVGYVAIPLAIEFSQWGFPVTYITSSFEGVKKAKKDCEIHSGSFKNLYYFDFVKDCPSAKVTIFIDVIDKLQKDEMFEFLDMLLRRGREIVCAVRNDRNWRDLLSGKYLVNVSEYRDKQFCLLTLKENG